MIYVHIASNYQTRSYFMQILQELPHILGKGLLKECLTKQYLGNNQ